MLPGQVRHQRGDAAHVVHEHDVEPVSSRRPAMTATGIRPARRRRSATAMTSSATSSPSTLPDRARTRCSNAWAAGAERQQQGVLGIPQHRLGRVHDLVDEQQALALDVDLGAAAFQADETDDVLAAQAQPLGVASGTKPSASITACTRWRVSACTRWSRA